MKRIMNILYLIRQRINKTDLTPDYYYWNWEERVINIMIESWKKIRNPSISSFHYEKKNTTIKKKLCKKQTQWTLKKRNTSYNLLCTITVDLKKNQLPYVLFSWNFRKVEKFKDTYIVQLMKKESNSALLFHKHGEKKITLRDFCYKKKTRR